jgi:hypothetical protein
VGDGEQCTCEASFQCREPRVPSALVEVWEPVWLLQEIAYHNDKSGTRIAAGAIERKCGTGKGSENAMVKILRHK